jgi:hypothetical protein
MRANYELLAAVDGRRWENFGGTICERHAPMATDHRVPAASPPIAALVYDGEN